MERKRIEWRARYHSSRVDSTGPFVIFLGLYARASLHYFHMMDMTRFSIYP